jgi:hypothetical protein
VSLYRPTAVRSAVDAPGYLYLLSPAAMLPLGSSRSPMSGVSCAMEAAACDTKRSDSPAGSAASPTPQKPELDG